MADTKWTIPEKVTFVIRNKYYEEEDIKSAFVVFDDNKKTMVTATSWAGKEYTTVTTDNDGFELELISAAQGSYSQSGKLSFWMCRVKKEGLDLDVKVGINSDLLCALMQETVFDKGKCTSKLLFAHYGSVLGVLSKDTMMYQLATEGMNKKVTLATTKTSKWEKGVFYESAKTKSIWLCDIHLPIDIDFEASRWGNDKTFTVEIKANDIIHFVTDYKNYSYNPKTQKGELADYVYDNLSYGFKFHASCKEKFPARSKTDSILDIKNVDHYMKKYLEERVAELIDSMKLYEGKKWNVFSSYHWEDVFYLFASVDGKLSEDNLKTFKDYLSYTKFMKDINSPNIFKVKEGNTETTFDSYESLWLYVIERLEEKYA